MFYSGNMKTRHVLFAILVAVLVLLYLAWRRPRHPKGGKARTKLASLGSRMAASLSAGATPCDYLAEDNPDAAAECKTYLAVCGTSSTASEVLNLLESSSGSGDPRILTWIAGDVKSVQADKSQCAPAMDCPNGQSDCPSEFPSLKCIKGSCV